MLVHWSACLAFFQPARCDLMYCSAAASKVNWFAAASFASALARSRSAIGSRPSASILAAWLARALASGKLNTVMLPRPISRSRPPKRYLKIQLFAPDALTARYRRPPSG